MNVTVASMPQGVNGHLLVRPSSMEMLASGVAVSR